MNIFVDGGYFLICSAEVACEYLLLTGGIYFNDSGKDPAIFLVTGGIYFTDRGKGPGDYSSDSGYFFNDRGRALFCAKHEGNTT